MNGMDSTDWNPAVDKFLDVQYDAQTVEEGKAIAKETLQAELGLEVRLGCQEECVWPWRAGTSQVSLCM